MRLLREDDVLDIIERVTNEAVEKKQRKYLIQPRIIAEITALDPVDAELVKHGRWMVFPECLEYEGALDTDYIVCSECHHVWNVIDNCTETFKCCPNCGARMDGGVEDETD